MRGVWQMRAADGTPAAGGAAGAIAPDAAKTPWRTPPPVFEEAETPVAASGWQELCTGGEDGAQGIVQGLDVCAGYRAGFEYAMVKAVL